MNLSFTFPGGTFPFVAACLPACLPAPVSLACERLCAPGQTDRRRQAQYSQLIRSFVCYQVCKTKKWSSFGANWYKWSTDQRHETIKGQRSRSREAEGRIRHHYWPPMSRSSATKMSVLPDRLYFKENIIIRGRTISDWLVRDRQRGTVLGGVCSFMLLPCFSQVALLSQRGRAMLCVRQ